MFTALYTTGQRFNVFKVIQELLTKFSGKFQGKKVIQVNTVKTEPFCSANPGQCLVTCMDSGQSVLFITGSTPLWQ